MGAVDNFCKVRYKEKHNTVASNSDCEVTCQRPISVKWNEMSFLDISSLFSPPIKLSLPSCVCIYIHANPCIPNPNRSSVFQFECMCLQRLFLLRWVRSNMAIHTQLKVYIAIYFSPQIIFLPYILLNFINHLSLYGKIKKVIV